MAIRLGDTEEPVKAEKKKRKSNPKDKKDKEKE